MSKLAFPIEAWLICIKKLLRTAPAFLDDSFISAVNSSAVFTSAFAVLPEFLHV
jgi:hypothetical protein